MIKATHPVRKAVIYIGTQGLAMAVLPMVGEKKRVEEIYEIGGDFPAEIKEVFHDETESSPFAITGIKEVLTTFPVNESEFTEIKSGQVGEKTKGKIQNALTVATQIHRQWHPPFPTENELKEIIAKNEKDYAEARSRLT